jgi:hypothetical protein
MLYRHELSHHTSPGRLAKKIIVRIIFTRS